MACALKDTSDYLVTLETWVTELAASLLFVVATMGIETTWVDCARFETLHLIFVFEERLYQL